MTSMEWKNYFERNARSLLDVPWHVGKELSTDEIATIAKSLRAFQAGESSEGRHLYAYAKAYAARSGDEPYVSAIRLFIAEEQRHARDLKRFLELNDIELVRTTFTDIAFRKLCHLFAGLEISIAVLITAEVIAQVYYAAIRDATRSTILRRLCEQILSDELQHVNFQAERLALLRRDRSRFGLALTMAVQRCLFVGTTLLVGALHRRAIAGGGYPMRRWWRECWKHFNGAFDRAAQVVSAASAESSAALALKHGNEVRRLV